MSPRFLHIWPWLMNWEGVKFENDPDDPGNYANGKLVGTKYGIDARSHPNVDIRNLTEEAAKQIYWDDYWQKNGCEEKGFPLGEVYFNAAVNCGSGRAMKLLSESGNDSSKFLDAQAAFYHRLVQARPKSVKYLKGWLNRVNSLRTFLKL